jgi:septal ring factor EnvC (AmiA/AmiB activator)
MPKFIKLKRSINRQSRDRSRLVIWEHESIETADIDAKLGTQRQTIIVIIWTFEMTFEEMQSIMQSVITSQREMQATQREFQDNQREMQATQREFQDNQREMQADREQMQATLRETQHLAQSIARGVQAMQDKALSDELKRDEEKALHEAQMAELRDISRGLVNMLSSIDEDRPTILRKLNTIENKTDTIIDRLNRN